MARARPSAIHSASSDALAHISSFLTPHDLLALSATSSHLHSTLLNSVPVWSQYLIHYYNEYPSSPSSPSPSSSPSSSTSSTPYQRFSSLYTQRLGQAGLLYYKRLLVAWQRVRGVLGEAMWKQLQLRDAGVSEEQWREVLRARSGPGGRDELLVLQRLPADVLLSACVVDGQAPTGGVFRRRGFGVLGTFAFYDVLGDFALLPLDGIMRLAATAAGMVVPEGAVPITYPFPTPHVMLFADEYGRIFRNKDGERHVCWPSFTDMLEEYADRLEAGVYEVAPFSDDSNVLHISRFPTSSPLGSDTTTRGIRIRVDSIFVPELSNYHRYFFAYRVRITYEPPPGEMPITAQLTTRRWHITDGAGDVETVEGPGVVGLFPRVFLGCEPFKYESCTHSTSPRGSMRGAFFFQVEGSDELIEARIDNFFFDVQRSFV